MKDKSIKNKLIGVAFIAFAICLLLDNINVYPDLPLYKIGIVIILACVMIDSIRRLNFIGITLPLGIAACIFRTELGIPYASATVIGLVSILIGAGLSLIFGGNKIKIDHVSKDKGSSIYSEGEGEFDVDNSFGTRTEYVTVKNLRKGSIDNSMGNLTVFLSGSTVDPEGAFLDIDNGMGNLTVFFPKEFRISFHTDNGLGNINMHGECSRDESQPLINAKLDNGFGNVDIYFE